MLVIRGAYIRDFTVFWKVAESFQTTGIEERIPFLWKVVQSYPDLLAKQQKLKNALQSSFLQPSGITLCKFSSKMVTEWRRSSDFKIICFKKRTKIESFDQDFKVLFKVAKNLTGAHLWIFAFFTIYSASKF